MAETTIQEKTAAVGKLFGTAAKLTQKQAELAKLNNVTLPKLYHAIGKRIVGMEKLPADLEHRRQTLRQLEAGITATPEEIKSDPTGGFAAKAKQFARQATQKAAKAIGDASATVQIQVAYVAIGKTAVETYGEKAVPKELRPDLAAATAKYAELESGIAELMATTSVRFCRPPRLAIIGIGLFLLSWFLPAGGPMYGWEAFCGFLIGSPWVMKVAPLTNIIACVSIAVLFGWHRRSLSAVRLMQLLLVLCILWNSQFLCLPPRIGYFAWQASFILFFLAMRTQSQLAARLSGDELNQPATSPPWAIVQAIATMAVAVLCVSSLLHLGTQARSAADSTAVSVATSSPQSPPQPPASDTSNYPQRPSAPSAPAAMPPVPAMLCPACGGTGRAYVKQFEGQLDLKTDKKCQQCYGSGTRRVGF